MPGKSLHLEPRRQPIHKQITDRLKERVLRGDYLPGELGPSERDLQEEFNTSSTTARRCLNDLEREGLVYRKQGVGTIIRERTAEAATRSIGILYHELAALTTTTSSSVLRGMFRVISGSRYYPELINSRLIANSPNPSLRLLQVVESRYIDGLALLSPTPVAILQDALRARVPIVSNLMEYDAAQIYGVVSNTPLALAELIGQLEKLGHRRLLVYREVFPEVMEGITSSKPPAFPPSRIQIDYLTGIYGNYPQVEQTLRYHLAEEKPPTAILVFGYELSLHVRHLLRAWKYKVPEDISLIFFGVPAGPSSFCSLEAPGEQSGEETIQALFTLLSGHRPLERVRRLPVRFVLGETLGKAPRQPKRLTA